MRAEFSQTAPPSPAMSGPSQSTSTTDPPTTIGYNWLVGNWSYSGTADCCFGVIVHAGGDIGSVSSYIIFYQSGDYYYHNHIKGPWDHGRFRLNYYPGTNSLNSIEFLPSNATDVAFGV